MAKCPFCKCELHPIEDGKMVCMICNKKFVVKQPAQTKPQQPVAKTADWSKYEGEYDGVYYDPFEVLYKEGKPSVQIAQLIEQHIAETAPDETSEPESPEDAPERIYGGGFFMADEAFKNCADLTTLTIPDTISRIGESAFENCTALKEVIIGDGVTVIDDSAFYGCTALESVTIGANVIKIGDYAFGNCPNLKSITIPNGVISIGDYAFDDCENLKEINIPDSVVSIGQFAFDNTAWYNNKTDGVIYAGKVAYKYKGDMPNNALLTLKNGTRGIANGAFEYCKNLKSVVPPDSVIFIGGSAFYDTGWYNSQPDGPVYAGKVLYKYKGKLPEGEVFRLKPDTLGIAESAFGNGDINIKSIFIPKNVKTIGNHAFLDCKQLISVTIPASVIYIGDSVFGNCENLASINVAADNPYYHSDGNCLIDTYDKTVIAACASSVIPTDGSVTSIGKYAFRGTETLTEVEIPDAITYIGNGAFMDCDGLEKIFIPKDVRCINSNAFNFCSTLDVLEVSIENVRYQIVNNCLIDKQNKKLVLGCGSSVIPSDGSVTTIGNSAFYENSSIKRINIPNSVTKIENNAFSGCENLKIVNLGNALTDIGSAFDSSGIINITIPDSVKRIGNWAFGQCKSLLSVNIGAGVKKIEDNAFLACPNLSDIIYNGTMEEWNLIEKEEEWNYDCKEFVVHCIDGDLDSAGDEI